MTAAQPLIAFAHVGKSFDGGRVKAVDDVTLDVAAGEFLAIVGGSGSGNSLRSCCTTSSLVLPASVGQDSVRLLRGTGAARLAPADAAAWNTPLLVHSPGMHAPAAGAMVRITVAGQAHVFGA